MRACWAGRGQRRYIAFREGRFGLPFERPVTVIVGENGVGKSTLLEATAGQIGFSMQSGTCNYANR